MKKTDPAIEQLFWHTLAEYWRAYEDYEAMCREQKLKRDGFPYCLCWPDHCKKGFFVSLVILVAGSIGLVLEFWRRSQSSYPEDFDLWIMFFSAIGTVMGLIYTWHFFFPDQYRSACRHYYNVLYFRSRSEKNLEKLERALDVIRDAVAPYREQKQLEAEEEERRIAAEKQAAKEKYLKCFRPLWAYLKETLDLDAEDFDPEQVDEVFSVLVPNEDGAETEGLTRVEFEYSEKGLQEFIDGVAEIEAERARKNTQQKLCALCALCAETRTTLADSHP